MKDSIRRRLTIAFISLTISPLLLVGLALAWQSFTVQQQQGLNLQHEVAQRVSNQVDSFFKDLEGELRIISQVQGLQELDQTGQYNILSELLTYQDVFEELILLDKTGQEQVHISRLNLKPIEQGQRAQADEFLIPQTQGLAYYSPIWFDETTGEPSMIIAIPLPDPRTGSANGVLIAEARLKEIWNLIADIQLSPGQDVYIVDAQDRIVAHRNPSIVLRGDSFYVPDREGIHIGLGDTETTLVPDKLLERLLTGLVKSLTGGDSVLAFTTVQLGEQEFRIVAQQTLVEALSLAFNTVFITAFIILIALVISGAIGLLIVHQIVQPIQVMATVAQAISAGDLLRQVPVTRQDELGILGEAFNSMTVQLQELITGLEERVTDRTRRLEVVASLSERLTAILKLEELLHETVKQIKEQFGYYHTHIYLLDDNREKLWVAAGTGEAGAAMMSQSHNIALDAQTSLVARAARTGEIVKVDNVRETPDWLPNPLLPDTHSEMVVPIIVEGQTVGVLDVQQDRVAGLDEGDANLLRSLANHAAVAIRNARLFYQVETALAEARSTQKRYEQQAWETVARLHQGGLHQYQRLDALSFKEAVFEQLERQAMALDRPALLEVSNDESEEHPALVAPIKLQEQKIGAIQLHWAGKAGHPWQREREVALVQAVADQVAQVAENLRLFEETRQQASFESLAGEITQKLRQAADMETLVKTAAEELGKALGVPHSLVRLGVQSAAIPAPNGPVGDNNGHS